ncbi:MAG: DNA polymerase III subunit delta', partial [Candidatus Omnitrophota bacterium]|nr:DNA polymerase III subunit delta' [Candidatus Omnitrophota bacterium]
MLEGEMPFSAIRGQDKQIGMLKVYIEQSRLGGGYLFCGPQGIGKKMTAVALAKTLNCQEGGLDACGKCPSCLKIGKKQHPDVHFLEFDGDEIKI